ncbi:putative ATP-dependent RNA helicase TDRD12 isoform X2 [Saccostrea echinata]|uniref:putative ATP-dependent RNA helicase TDRD12 isoform X2 n=1 Tax=Saccostrea echinata TaxID=191078 RepID=UPI002A806585|nr:putative ATP-dependent RNA helicase TDRD12 isoform X2 [Saccostrea echinata]
MPGIQIEIFEVRSPGLFYGREVKESSSERVVFNQFEHNLNKQYENPQSCSLYQPANNEVCIGKAGDKWCRVRVEEIYRRQRGHEAKCFLLDFGTMEMIPFQWLRKANQSHLSVPYQVKCYSLYGIQAQTMALQEDLSCHMEPCVAWDESATEYMKKCLQNTAQYFVDVKNADMNKVEVILYIKLRNGEVCFNDDLVRNKYAVRKNPEDVQNVTPPDNKTRSQPLTIEGELNRLELKKSKLKSKTTPSSSDIDSVISGPQTTAQGTDSESSKSGSVLESRRSGLGRGFSLGQTLREWKGKSKTENSKDTESLVRKDSNSSGKTTTGRNNGSSSQSLPADPEDSHMLSFVHRHQKPRSTTEQKFKMSIGRKQGSSQSLSSGEGSVMSAPSIKSLHTPMNGMLGRLMSSLIAAQPSTTPQPSVSDSELLKSNPSNAIHRSVHTEGSSSESVQKNIRTFTPSSLQKLQQSVEEPPFVNTSSVSMDCNKNFQVPKRIDGENLNIGSSSSGEVVNSLSETLSNENVRQPESTVTNIRDQIKDLRVADSRGDVDRRTDMMSKIQGDRIMANLSGGAKPISASTAVVSRKFLDGVLVHSEKTITPYLNFDDTPLVPELKEILKGFEFPSPMLIQAYGWPGILKLNHVVGVSPVNTGKTFTYLCPLLSELLHPLSYKELAIGNGPLALVLVSSWKKAQSVYDVTTGLLRDHHRPRPLVIYGGGCEHNQYVPLMNGCEILIATPPCLVRMINRRYTDLQRLCHLVVDDADLLLKEYSEEVQEIMDLFAEARKENIHKAVPYQIITMGTQWTPAVHSFTQAYMPDPTIIITSRFEAAIYGKVIQHVEMCQSSQRSTRLLEVLDSVLSNGVKVIIFTTTVNDVCFLIKLLKSHSLCCLKIHHQMESYEIEMAVHDWKSGSEKDGPKLLVCTDECISDIKIDDANAVIHYDIPAESKSRFGNRLSCLRKYYAHYSGLEEEEGGQNVKPISYILMTEQSTGQARSVRDLLRRLKLPIPRELTALLAGMKQQQEEDKEKGLCSYLKAYGACRFQTRCPYRHIILPDVDKPCCDLLTSGEIKIRVTDVVNATCYYARVLEHRKRDGPFSDLSNTALSIMFEIENWFSSENNRVRLGNVCAGDVCAIEEDNSFFRVQIQDIKGSNSPGSKTMQAQVFFVDEGRVKDVSMFKLYELPPHLKSYPFQTVEVYLCRLRPIDRDENWTSNADQFVHGILQDKVLYGRIVLSIGNTVWLDPLVERQRLRENKGFINKMYVRSELLRNGYAVENEEHVQNLYRLCEGLLPIPTLPNTEDNMELSVETDLLPEDEEFHTVYVSACEDPGLFFIQRCQFVKQMDAMIDAINDKLQKTEVTPMKVASCQVGLICLGKYTQDDAWYRVKIVECVDNGDYKVMFCDQGDYEVLPISRLHPFPQEYSEIPMLAIECELAHIQPRGEGWDESAGDALWDMTHTVAGGNKKLMAKVIGKKDSSFTGIHRYIVELWDTYTANDINLAQELVWSGLASPKEGSNLQEMFQKPPMINFQVYRNPVQMVMDLCACLYWRKDQKRKIPPALEIFDIVTKAVNRSPLDLVGYRGLAAIIKLIGRLTDDTAHKCLLESLLIAAENNDRLAEEIVNQDGDHCVIQCLDQKSRPKIQTQALEAIYRLIKCNNRFVKAFSDASVLECLCEILEVAEEPEILYGTGRALNIICKQSKSASDIVYHFKVCELITESLKRTDDLQACQSLMQFLVTLVNKNGKREPLHNEKLAKVVVSKMSSFLDDMCISCGVTYCENLCKENRKKKTFLLEQGVVVILKKAIKQQKLCPETYGKCERFLNSLVIQVPTSSSINSKPIHPSRSGYPRQTLVPIITWAQNKRNVILAVRVARAGDAPVKVNQNSFFFRTVVDDTLYEAKYELFGRIQPDACHVSVKRSEVLVKLRKDEPGSWPRLLKLKTKFPNISLDYDKFACSSSEEDISDDNNPFVLKKRKVKKFPKDMKRPKGLAVGEGYQESEEDSEEDEDDSEEVTLGLEDDPDPYDVFGKRS